MKKFKNFNDLPLLGVSFETEERFKNKFVKALIDIYDGDFWTSKISVVGNLSLIAIILINILEIIFSNSPFLKSHQTMVDAIDFSISIIFSIEIISRIYLAPYTNKKYAGKFGRIKYVFSFYNMVDLLSIITFWSALVGVSFSSSLKIFRVLRIWRIIRFIPSFGFISTALHKKRDEINASMLGVFFLSTTISALIYHVEKDAGSSSFKSVMEVMAWSIGEYTGDYGSIAVYIPITLFGKILATVNGLLGIALFALPAGLIGSAFIDEIGERKRVKDLERHVEEIDELFELSYLPNNTLLGKSFYYRHLKFHSIQAELLITEEEMLKCIRNHPNFRCRIKKGIDSIYIERFNLTTSYGFKKINPNNKVCVVNAFGESHHGFSHFTSSLASILNFNLISVEKRIYDNKQLIDFNQQAYFQTFFSDDDDKRMSLPTEYREFLTDLHALKPEHIAVIIKPCKSGLDVDFIVDESNFVSEGETNKNAFYLHLKKQADSIEYLCQDEAIEKLENLIVTQRIRKERDFEFADQLHLQTKANVITVFINEKHLVTSNHNKYYAVMQEFVNVFNLLYPSSEK